MYKTVFNYNFYISLNTNNTINIINKWFVRHRDRILYVIHNFSSPFRTEPQRY